MIKTTAILKKTIAKIAQITLKCGGSYPEMLEWFTCCWPTPCAYFKGFVNEKDEFMGPETATKDALKSGQITEKDLDYFSSPKYLEKAKNDYWNQFFDFNDCDPNLRDYNHFKECCKKRILHPYMLWPNYDNIPKNSNYSKEERKKYYIPKNYK